ncbi:CubicO group peptidase (beta-lactamase class C family) [Microbacterium endophyticum]|uniref:CubicO group peptidase (Beta-lactamase class C family) n=1 Tax=Microbacterium endophyticum TaxID=1526412 RepID=A0A7W4V638_9MICO|nr:beta-lactamase family protein [Microbacterium endophyticum]MBB2977134.1 CubicO group peptidase (beta-lactamase class C family) [Microbacterium endophyticum]NIK36062.1 CubicO group peptidase (beta-lactamase class C family) [Microbacterium endophyticum]
METSSVHGVVAPGFERVADVFATTARERGGSALSIRVGGELVVDIWQGSVDSDGAKPWQANTPTAIFSCTKGLVAMLLARIVQEGKVDLDAPVARYWPEFAAAGKERITVRQLAAHRAGLAAPRIDIDRETALDWNRMVTVLAAQEPLWEPGSTYGYHALTFGWLVGEVIRRVTGISVGQYLRETLTVPLHADAWIGLPESVEPRVARLLAGDTLLNPAPGPALDPEQASWMGRAMTLGDAFPAALVLPGEGFDDPAVHRAEVPGAGGIATASALAALWSSTVVSTERTSPLDAAVVDDMTAVQSEGEPVWWIPGPYPKWGTGFMLDSQRREFLSPSSFGHDGAGGQVAFADRDAEVGFGYVTNLFEIADDERGTELVRALRRALG